MTTWPNWVDLVVVSLVLIKCYKGFQRGIVTELLRLIGLVGATGFAVNYASVVGAWIGAWVRFGPLSTECVTFWLLFLGFVYLVRVALRGIAQLIKWERIHWITNGLGLALGALRGLWWSGLFLLALSSSGFVYLRESVEQRSVLGPRMLPRARAHLERLSDVLPGHQNRGPMLIPPVRTIPR